MAHPCTRARAGGASCVALTAFAAAVGCGPASAYVPPGFSPAEAAWEVHHDEERAGSLDAAAQGYGALCEAEPDFTRACYDRARVLFDAGRTAEARAEAVEFAIAHPGHALAPAAVGRLAASYVDAGEAGAGIAALEQLASRTRGTDVWDSTMYEIARAQRSRGEDEREASALAEIVDRGRWGSQLWDNSIWRLIDLASSRGERGEERRLLEKLIATQEESRIIASYNSQYHDDALLRLGRLLLDEGQLDLAHGVFMKLAGWETSRKRDDGYYWAAVVRLRQGRVADACALLRVVFAKMPWSNSFDDAAGLMREAKCGGAGAEGASGQ